MRDMFQKAQMSMQEPESKYDGFLGRGARERRQKRREQRQANRQRRREARIRRKEIKNEGSQLDNAAKKEQIGVTQQLSASLNTPTPALTGTDATGMPAPANNQKILYIGGGVVLLAIIGVVIFLVMKK